MASWPQVGLLAEVPRQPGPGRTTGSWRRCADWRLLVLRLVRLLRLQVLVMLMLLPPEPPVHWTRQLLGLLLRLARPRGYLQQVLEQQRH